MVAGACLCIAMRESGRPDSLKDIAFLLERSDTSVKRTLSSVLRALNLTLTRTGPAQFFPTLQSHLHSILQSPVESSGLNISLYSELKSVSVQSATETARLFVDTLARFSPETSLSQLSPAALACAILILSLEAEKRSALSHLADISTSFANRCQVAKATVMQRYKALQDEVAKWTEEVRWLDSYQKSSKQAKVSKRLLCARSLKDALNWKSSLWKKRVEKEGKLNVEPHLNNVDSDSESECSSSWDVSSSNAKSEDSQPSRKKRKVVHSAIADGAHFLLDPVHSSLSRRASKVSSSTASLGTTALSNRTDAFTMSCYLLSVPSFISSTRTIPSRLQQLSVARGSSDVILDDELLAEGEWETIQRSPEEMERLEQRWRDEGLLDVLEKASSAALKKHEARNRARASEQNLAMGTRHRTSKRINLEALAQFMRSGDESDQMFDLDILGLEVLEDEKTDDEYEEEGYIHGTSNAYGAQDELTVDDWRPCSPGLDKSFDDYYL